METAAQFDSTRENLPGPAKSRIVSLKSLHDFFNGGAWPFLVRATKCLVDSVNERDLHQFIWLRDTLMLKRWRVLQRAVGQ